MPPGPGAVATAAMVSLGSADTCKPALFDAKGWLFPAKSILPSDGINAC
jgi:hypothetical protein